MAGQGPGVPHPSRRASDASRVRRVPQGGRCGRNEPGRVDTTEMRHTFAWRCPTPGSRSSAPPGSSAQRHHDHRDDLPQADQASHRARHRGHGPHLPGRSKLRCSASQLVTRRRPRGCLPSAAYLLSWSGWPDLNRRPLRPERSALPSCATPRPRGGRRASRGQSSGKAARPGNRCARGPREGAAGS